VPGVKGRGKGRRGKEQEMRSLNHLPGPGTLRVMEARAGIEPAIELLQSPALPLGYLAITLKSARKTDGRH